jgi:hypothetical protein
MAKRPTSGLPEQISTRDRVLMESWSGLDRISIETAKTSHFAGILAICRSSAGAQIADNALCSAGRLAVLSPLLAAGTATCCCERLPDVDPLPDHLVDRAC